MHKTAMTIEVTILISALSVAFAIYSGISNMKRNAKNDVSRDASQLTTVIIKLENIESSINEMKSDLKDVRTDVKEHSITLANLTQRIVALEKNVFGNHNRKDGDNNNE